MNNMFTKEELKKIFNQKKQKNNNGKTVPGFIKTTFEQFEKWFDEDVFKRGCHYCGTTNERSNHLYQLQMDKKRPNGTRGGKRGKRLELDRIDPNQPYDNLDNLVWCCYWCNCILQLKSVPLLQLKSVPLRMT